MWDACFESLESIAAGHPGGGCILAHCMGLGKTLQVLALLHTVSTLYRSLINYDICDSRMEKTKRRKRKKT